MKMKIPRLEYVGEKKDFILNTLKNESVLHLGCVDFYLEDVIKDEKHLHIKLLDITKELYGIDYNKQGLEYLERQYKITNLYYGNVEKLADIEINKKFHFILAGELIEHLNNPGLFLEGVQKFMDEDSILLLTTPNAYSLKTFAHLFTGYEQIEGDHSLILSFSTALKLLSRYNLKITRWVVACETQKSKKSKIMSPFFDKVYKLIPQVSDKLILFCKINK